MRKGRFDEIFFVDLPDLAARRDIFSIHLRNRNFDPGKFDIATLAAAAEQFSGAEIEQAIVAALYSSSARREPLQTDAIAAEIAGTYPLAITLAEKITALRLWAEGRTVSAG
jgi:SpoVK/Ycf46/Vps4 family AAA+-type ATPase